MHLLRRCCILALSGPLPGIFSASCNASAVANIGYLARVSLILFFNFPEEVCWIYCLPGVCITVFLDFLCFWSMFFVSLISVIFFLSLWHYSVLLRVIFCCSDCELFHKGTSRSIYILNDSRVSDNCPGHKAKKKKEERKKEKEKTHTRKKW